MKREPVDLPRLSVRTKILLLFLGLSLLSILVCGIVAYATINNVGNSAEASSLLLGNRAVNDASRALERSAEKNLVQLATDQAEITNVLFEDTVTEMELLGAQAETAGHNAPLIPLTPAYPRDAPPVKSTDTAVIFLAPGTDLRDDTEYRTVNGMSDLVRAVYRADTNLTSVYVATDSGIVVMYPWRSFPGGTIDPRNRDWFTGAKSTPGVYWSEPYLDSAGHGLVVTSSKAVRTPYGTWVVGSDVTVDAISTVFLNKTLGGKGYAVLMDSRGNIVSRPGLSAPDTTDSAGYVPENVFRNRDDALAAISRNMTAGRIGLEKVNFGGTETYVAYAPVRSQNWSYALSMPVDEITAPVKSTRDQIASATRTTKERITEHTEHIRDIFGALILVIVLIVALLAFYLARLITRPVEVLRKGASALGRGDLSYRVRLDSDDEFGDLARSFNSMAEDLKTNIANLQRTTKEKERYTKELEIAKEIQESFLPESIPVIPGYDLAAATVPAMEIGGDLYDVIALERGQWGLVIADVSGKSVSAALYMALSRTLIHASGTGHASPTPAMQWVNRMLFDDGRSGMFITIIYGILDPAHKTFTYVNAGHNPPLLLKKKEEHAQYIESRDIALGVLEEVPAASRSIPLESGDLLFLYTDGITEAFNETDECYGEERLAAYLERNRTLSAHDLIDGLLREIQVFRGSAPQSDDITLLVLRVA
jgi:sigma-B regulation protein RsbU (phosphoserine phosphatase)